ncbi:RagB/SusD family nutrient uptake outer membrane protein [Mucilaginibacter sp. SP1R1]
MNERRFEFAFENKRWLDLVRTGQAVQITTAYGARIKANPQAYYFFRLV